MKKIKVVTWCHSDGWILRMAVIESLVYSGQCSQSLGSGYEGHLLVNFTVVGWRTLHYFGINLQGPKRTMVRKGQKAREETEEYSSPKPNPPSHPPTFNTSKSLNLASTKNFHWGASKNYRQELRRIKSTPQIGEKNDCEQDFHGQVLVLNQPDKWCIYRVPSKLRKVNEAAYTPQLLSIGLFHYGKPELKDMETHKTMYYKNFSARYSKTEDALKNFITGRQESILHCYAGAIELIDKEPVDVIVVDACFIIQLFLMNSKEIQNHENDYILRSPWLRKAVEQELILFENQLPYSLLQDLYDFVVLDSRSPHSKEAQEHEQAHRKSSANHDQQDCSGDHFIDVSKAEPVPDGIDVPKAERVPDHPFLKLTCKFFKDYSKGKSVKNGVKPKHFTDLVRHFLCPEEEMTFEHNTHPIKNIYAVRKLKAAGVKFMRLPEDECFIIKRDKPTKCTLNLACFRNMNLKLAQFCVKDETECIIRNIMALEQFLYPDKPYICNYFMLMDQLVDTVEDVDLLVENKVIVNMLGSNEAVAKLVNRLCEQIMEDKSCYADVCKQLNNHYENFWNHHVATLKRVYFKDLWTGSSTILGLFVLVFSIIGSIKSLKS